ncbi:transposase [Candidatus Fukatsuia endosymbiont of Tuberolachnus salignus]|uniref:transposase n=1 Tax=Candidatus Fukatsuia endosymbiont of Tuberolachnus salignus TaxID=3077957 RepID=UPI003CC7A751
MLLLIFIINLYGPCYNVSFHKRQDIQSTIQKSGFILEYLPTYSPDLNPHFYPQR